MLRMQYQKVRRGSTPRLATNERFDNYDTDEK